MFKKLLSLLSPKRSSDTSLKKESIDRTNPLSKDHVEGFKEPSLEGSTAVVQFQVKPNTIFVLCGPTGCGKSVFAGKLYNQLTLQGGTCVIASSDAHRAHLLDHATSHFPLDGGRHSASAAAVSEGAFKLLMAQIEASTKFPVNTPFVIVDTTAFSEKFRETILELAERNGYETCLVVFDYKNRSEHLNHHDVGERAIREDSFKRFRKFVLPRMGGSRYTCRVKVPQMNSRPSVKVQWLESKLVLPGTTKAFIIGDSHECVEELKNLLSKVPQEEGLTIIHCGDFLDKGKNTVGMINFMYDRVKNKGDLLILGNHENYASKVSRGEIPNRNAEKEAENFSSVAILEDDSLPDIEGVRAKFRYLVEHAYDFIVIEGGERGSLPVYISHAPCENRYLGKEFGKAIQAQRNFRFPTPTLTVQDVRNCLEWIYTQADLHHPLHIFGHITHYAEDDKPFTNIKYKNKVFLDTGCVYGGKLTGVIVYQGKIDKVISVPGKGVLQEERIPFNLGVFERKFSEEDYDLTFQEARQLNHILKNEVEYLSGTMSPSASKGGELEPLETAFDAFQRTGVTEVVLEPKYMGSRCQAYIHKDRAKNKLVSRGGWVIKRVYGATEEELRTFTESLSDLYLTEETGFDSADRIILDGELLPWSALGEPLIEEQFVQYKDVVSYELRALEEALKSNPEEGPSGQVSPALVLEENYLEKKKAHLDKFSETLAIFAKSGRLEYKAFNILSIDGKPFNGTEVEAFYRVNKDAPILKVVLTSEKDVEKAKAFLKKLTVDEKMEGVVVKPITKPEPGAKTPPYIKVRSEEYLRLVYGYDYLDRLPQLIKQKEVRGKMSTSIREYHLGNKLLENLTRDDKKKTLLLMLGEFRAEKTLDPRL